MYRRTPIIYRIADSFFRYQALFWIALIVVSGLTMGLLYARSKTFHATALTQVNADNFQNPLGATDTNTWLSPAQRNVNSFNDLLKENQPGGFLDTALQNARLETPINVNPEADDPRFTQLNKSLSASVLSDNQFSLDLTWDNQGEAARIVSALQKQFITEVGINKSVGSIEDVRFLDGQIADCEQRMRVAELALTDYKRTYAGQLGSDDSTYNSQLSSLQAELDEKQITFGENGRRKAVLEQQLVQMPKMNILEKTTANESPLDRQVDELKARRDALLASGETAQHPDVVNLDAQIGHLQNEQKANAGAPENRRSTQLKMQDNPEYQNLVLQIAEAGSAQQADEQEMAHLHEQIAKYQLLVNQIPGAQRLLADKTRDYTHQQELYQKLVQERDQVQIQANRDRLTATSNLRPIGWTFALPTTGKTKMIAMFAGSLLLGCLVGIILIVLSEWSDHSLRHESDAEKLLGVPILASLPDAPELRLLSSGHRGGPKVLSEPER